MSYAGAEFWDEFFRGRRDSGQTMHFFSAAYLRELLGEWPELQLVPVPIAHRETGAPYKRVWRGMARR